MNNSLKLRMMDEHLIAEGWSSSAVVEVCSSSLLSSDRIVYYYVLFNLNAKIVFDKNDFELRKENL